jgi:hypothetical protein
MTIRDALQNQFDIQTFAEEVQARADSIVPALELLRDQLNEVKAIMYLAIEDIEQCRPKAARIKLYAAVGQLPGAEPDCGYTD